MLLALICCVLVAATWLHCSWRGSHWRRLGIRGPFGWPLVGNMLEFALGRRSYGEVYEWIYRQNPGQPYVGFYRLFNEPALLVRDQELVRRVLVGSSFADCSDNAVYVDHRKDVLASHNPFIAGGDRWRLFRSDLVPLFTPSRLRQMLPHVIQACQQLRLFQREHLNQERFEAKELATRYTLQVVASLIFGLDAHCLSGMLDESRERSNRWLHWLGPLFQPSSWSLLETMALLHSPRLGWVINFRYVPEILQRWIYELVAARRGTDNLLHCLTEASKRILDKDELAGHATTLLLEGYETSAMLLVFALQELASNLDVQQRLHQELDEQPTELDTATLAGLHYAEAVLLETLRLHPAMQALQKRCTQSFSFPSQTSDREGELRVQVGTVLVLPVQAIHLDPELHSEPNRFLPERFLNQSPSAQGCRFLGFGAGPRMCPGLRLGLLQTKAALATLLKEHRVLLVEEGIPAKVEVSPLTFLTSSKRGIWLRLEKRF